MAEFIESTGEIEIYSVSQQFRNLAAGDRIELVFKPIDAANPPYQLKIVSPSGSTIVDRILSALPTGEPQSAAPYEFSPGAKGVYRIEIREMRGRAFGTTKMRLG